MSDYTAANRKILFKKQKSRRSILTLIDLRDFFKSAKRAISDC